MLFQIILGVNQDHLDTVEPALIRAHISNYSWAETYSLVSNFYSQNDHQKKPGDSKS